MQALDDMELNKRAPRRPDVLFNTALSCVLLGGSLGGFMAWFNAWASPYYFQLSMGWGKEEVLMGSLIKGLAGGTVYGAAFAAFFVIVCGWATKFSCSFPFAFRQLAKAGALTLLGWALGGLLELSAYWLDMGNILPLPFEESADNEYQASLWVHGAINGQKVGYFLSVALSPLIVWQAWKKRPESPPV